MSDLLRRVCGDGLQSVMATSMVLALQVMGLCIHGGITTEVSSGRILGCTNTYQRKLKCYAI